MSYRTWTRDDEVRLEGLVRAVEQALDAGAGVRAAREAVPKWAEVDSISELARQLDMDRSGVSVCLSGDPSQPSWSVRRALEAHLQLPPGGMTRVLALVEPFHS